MSNSIVAAYAAHQAAVVGRGGGAQGGESAEWDEIAQFLCDLFIERLGELPLDPPLRYAWPYEVAQPNGVWPNLVIAHDASTPNDADPDAGWGYVQWRHEGQAVLIFGPESADENTIRRLGQPYLYPIWQVLRANQSLDGRCRRIEVGRQHWGLLTLGPQNARWRGLTTPFTIYAQGAVWSP